MKRLLAAIGASLFLLATPATLAAQVDAPAGEEAERLGEIMRGMFAPEPLTPEEEVRLPSAGAVVAKIMPDGIYARMMEDTIGGMLQPLLAMAPKAMPDFEIATRLGIPAERLGELDTAEIGRIGAMLDPAYAERQQLEMNYLFSRMAEVMAMFEPVVRDGLTRAYAKRFSEPELADIAGFFATPTGARYASESMLVFTDPQTMAASMEAMPAMMEMLPQMLQEVEAAAAQLPAERGHADLSADERASLAAALGMSKEALRNSMLKAERNREDAKTEAGPF